MSFGCVFFHQSLYLGPVQTWANEAQREQFMTPFLDGSKVGCFALSEPGKMRYALPLFFMQHPPNLIDSWLRKNDVLLGVTKELALNIPYLLLNTWL